jgi:hypothetical protein
MNDHSTKQKAWQPARNGKLSFLLARETIYFGAKMALKF